MDSAVVKLLTQSCEGLPELSEAAYDGLAQEADYRAREIIQEALKFATHAKRTRLCTEDVDLALKLRGVEQTYGYQDGEREQRFRSVEGYPGVSFLEDRVSKVQDLVEDQAFPLLPREKGLHLHWLAVRGKKTLIPENIKPKRMRASARGRGEDKANANATAIAAGDVEDIHEVAKRKRQEIAEDASTASQRTTLSAYGTNIGKGLKHVVSEELQTYFQTVTDAVVKNERVMLDPILTSLMSDPGLQPLIPYFASFIKKQSSEKEVYGDISRCQTLVDLIQCLVVNPHILWERYLHQVLPIVITFLVRNKMGRVGDDHWQVRRHAGRVLAMMCDKLENEKSSVDLQTKVARILVTKGLMDATKALTSHYGSIVGCSFLGEEVCRHVLLPIAPAYIAMLRQALEDKSNPLLVMEGLRCLEALTGALGNLVRKSSAGGEWDTGAQLFNIFGEDVLPFLVTKDKSSSVIITL